MVNTTPLSAVSPQASTIVTATENFINRIFGVTPSGITSASPTPTNPTLNYDWISLGVIGLAGIGIYYAVRKKGKRA